MRSESSIELVVAKDNLVLKKRAFHSAAMPQSKSQND